MSAIKILIVEDDASFSRILARCLEGAGYEVVTAADGQEALARASREQFDAVLLDLHLPHLSGMEVLRGLRTLGTTVPVVMMSGHGTIENAVEAIKLGALDFLPKPFAPEELRRLLAEVLARRAVEADQLDDYLSCLRFAKACLMQRDLDRARAALQKALSFDPWQPEPYNLLGVIAELSEDPRRGLKMYRVALALDPTYSPAKENLSRATRLPHRPPQLTKMAPE